MENLPTHDLTLSDPQWADYKTMVLDIQREINTFKTLVESNPNLSPTILIKNLCDIVDQRGDNEMEVTEAQCEPMECQDDLGPNQAGDPGAAQREVEPSVDEALRNLLIVERLFSFLSLDNLKVLRQVSKFFNDHTTKFQYEKYFLTLAPLIDSNPDEVLHKAHHLQNFLLKYTNKVSFKNIKPSTLSMSHFEDGIFHINLFSTNVRQLVFDEHERGGFILKDFCRRAKHMPNLRYLCLPELDISPNDEYWDILIHTFKALNVLQVKIASPGTLRNLLNLGKEAPDSVKRISILKWVPMSSTLMKDYLKAVGFKWKFRKIELDIESPTPVSTIHRFLEDQADSLEKLRIDFNPLGIGDPHPQNYPIPSSGNLTDDNWFLPKSLLKLKSLRCEQMEAPSEFLERTFLSILQLPGLKFLDMLEDTVRICDGWYEQITGLTRDVPLPISSLKSQYYLARLYELEKDYGDALPLYQELLGRQQEILGDNHVDTMKTQENIAMIYINSENGEARGLELFREISEKRKSIFGENDPSTLATVAACNIVHERIYSDKKPLYHGGTQCDGCGVYPVYFMRYRCFYCEDFDFCDLCYTLKHHMHKHFWTISFVDNQENQRQAFSEYVPWTSAANGDIPEGSLIAGQDRHGQDLIIARAKFGQDLLPGKLVRGSELAIVPWNSQARTVGEYETLTMHPDKVRWVKASDDEIVSGSIIGGITDDFEFLYIGRAMYEGSLELGKVHRSHRCLYISSGGVEIAIQDYEILVVHGIGECG